MAAPIANGVATKAESKVTTNEPKIIGSAPNLPSDGDQSPLKRNSIKLTLLTKKVASPFWATNSKIIATMKTIKARQRKVIVLPNFSRREFLEGDVNCFTKSSFFMLTPHSSL